MQDSSIETGQDKSFETLAVLYLAVPALFYLVAFTPWPMKALPLVGALVASWSMRNQRVSWRVLRSQWSLLLVALGGVWLSGALPPFAENSDWVKHYAILNTLADNPWPPVVEWQGSDHVLRYALGWYVVPALVGKVGGFLAMQIAVLLWSAIGLWIALVLAFKHQKQAVFASLIFLAFSGADILGTWWTQYQMGPLHHIEWWSVFGSMPSNVTSIFWTPQHAIPAWIGVFLFLNAPSFAVRHGALIGISVALWSPFAVIGLLPFAAWAAWPRIRDAVTVENFAIAAAFGIPAALFLTSGSSEIPIDPVWTHASFYPQMGAAFVTLEFGLICLAAIIARPAAGAVVMFCAAVLVSLVMIRVGVANDLLMRGSLPALGVLAVLCSKAVLSDVSGLRKAPLAALLIVGLATPMGEIMRGITAPRYDGSAIILLDILADNFAALAPQYLVPLD